MTREEGDHVKARLFGVERIIAFAENRFDRDGNPITKRVCGGGDDGGDGVEDFARDAIYFFTETFRVVSLSIDARDVLENDLSRIERCLSDENLLLLAIEQAVGVKRRKISQLIPKRKELKISQKLFDAILKIEEIILCDLSESIKNRFNDEEICELYDTLLFVKAHLDSKYEEWDNRSAQKSFVGGVAGGGDK